MKDKLGKIIDPGHHIVYASRRGSHMYLTVGVVVKVHHDRIVVRRFKNAPYDDARRDVLLRTPAYIVIVDPRGFTPIA